MSLIEVCLETSPSSRPEETKEDLSYIEEAFYNKHFGHLLSLVFKTHRCQVAQQGASVIAMASRLTRSKARAMVQERLHLLALPIEIKRMIIAMVFGELYGIHIGRNVPVSDHLWQLEGASGHRLVQCEVEKPMRGNLWEAYTCGSVFSKRFKQYAPRDPAIVEGRLPLNLLLVCQELRLDALIYFGNASPTKVFVLPMIDFGGICRADPYALLDQLRRIGFTDAPQLDVLRELDRLPQLIEVLWEPYQWNCSAPPYYIKEKDLISRDTCSHLLNNLRAPYFNRQNLPGRMLREDRAIFTADEFTPYKYKGFRARFQILLMMKFMQRRWMPTIMPDDVLSQRSNWARGTEVDIRQTLVIATVVNLTSWRVVDSTRNLTYDQISTARITDNTGELPAMKAMAAEHTRRLGW